MLYSKTCNIWEKLARGNPCFFILGAVGNDCLRRVHSLTGLPVEASVFSPPGSFLALAGKAASEGEHSPISLSSCVRPRISGWLLPVQPWGKLPNAIFLLLCWLLGRDPRGESIKPHIHWGCLVQGQTTSTGRQIWNTQSGDARGWSTSHFHLLIHCQNTCWWYLA